MQRRDPPAASRLPALMDQINDAVRRADFAALPALTAALEAAEPDVARMGKKGLADMRAKAQRNAASIAAARRGIKAARRRLDEVKTAARGFSTYDRSGKKVEATESRDLTKRF